MQQILQWTSYIICVHTCISAPCVLRTIDHTCTQTAHPIFSTQNPAAYVSVFALPVCTHACSKCIAAALHLIIPMYSSEQHALKGFVNHGACQAKPATCPACGVADDTLSHSIICGVSGRFGSKAAGKHVYRAGKTVPSAGHSGAFAMHVGAIRGLGWSLMRSCAAQASAGRLLLVGWRLQLQQPPYSTGGSMNQLIER